VPRLTRAESQARTRAQLLTTARELFLRDGYLPTSLDRVAETAGFSKGAVYSNFQGKDELCVAVLDQIRAERASEIIELLRAPTVDERMRRFEEWAEQVIGDPQWTTLELEFAVHAAREPRLREELGGRISLMGAAVEAMIKTAADNDGASPVLPEDELGIALLAMGVGLGFFRSFAPMISVRALVDSVRIMAGLGPAATEAERR
jgi:AcrR family transcriptional regulator